MTMFAAVVTEKFLTSCYSNAVSMLEFVKVFKMLDYYLSVDYVYSNKADYRKTANQFL